jgi:protein-L-isoaspartate(D-aspartate) O-methyltransferase
MNSNRIGIWVGLCWLCGVGVVLGQGRDPYESARKRMVEKSIINAGVKNERVIESMRTTPRHEFVTRNYWPQAYFDMALPIGEEQTISSPFVVAYMTESIDPQSNEKVLEIGTGSGYQAAVLSPLCKEVYTIEIVEELGRNAARTLRRLKYDNVFPKVGDGYLGWPEKAPFDKIIVTCSPEKVPRPLVEQLREGGRIVIPVGERYQQTMYLLTKRNGEMVAEALRPTLFVPMTGRAEEGRVVQPDGTKPAVVNGSFEEEPDEEGNAPGWYYQQQAEWEEDIKSPRGKHCLTFKNKEFGQASHAMQGFAIDGRKVTSLKLSGHAKCKDVRWGKTSDMRPMVVVSLYDEDHKELGSWWLGPWNGDSTWDAQEKSIRVPPTTREGILRIGLFGAIGEVSFDEIRFTPTVKGTGNSQ